MDGLDIDFNQVINSIMLSSIAKESPQAAKIISVLVKYGHNVQDSLAILLEIGEATKEV